MKNYTLQKDETVLYKGNVLLLNEENRGKIKKVEAELILTNLNLVFITSVKKLFRSGCVKTEVFSLEEVKIYNDSPQIIRKNLMVSVYLLSSEKFFEFSDKKEVKDFTDKALRVVSGKSKFVRAVKKAQKAIKETEDELGIDLVGAAKTTAGIAGSVMVKSTENTVGAKTRFLGVVAKTIMNPNKKNQNKALSITDDKIEKLKEIKDLWDSGAITQTEYDKMKASLLQD